YNHLARASARVGDVVRRGQRIALSGYSGIDALVAFPWSVPHVHFNVWLDGEYVDPFAADGETSLWNGGNDPRPDRHGASADGFTDWNARAVDDAIAVCKDAEVRRELESEEDLARRAMNLLFHRNYYPTRFEAAPRVYDEAHARAPWLDLPFAADDFAGTTFPRGRKPCSRSE
ncbi:MAG: M23 family metallopeptidase, partial [Gemmatimonadales bacterium]